MTKEHFLQTLGALLVEDAATKRWYIEQKTDDYKNQYAGILKLRLTTGDWIEGEEVEGLADDSFVLVFSSFERGPVGGKNLAILRRYVVRYELVAFACLELSHASAKSSLSR